MSIAFVVVAVVVVSCYLFVFWQLATWQVAPEAEIIRAKEG